MNLKKSVSNNIPVILLIVYSSLIVAIDQFAKYVAIKGLVYEVPYSVIRGFFNLTLVFNRGGAFGVLNTKPSVFLFISLMTLTLMFVICYRMRNLLVVTKIPFAMVMGGAIGNLIDRIARGYVIDYLDFYIGPYHWPAFNVADSAISIGVFLLLWFIWKEEKKTVTSSIKGEQ